VPYISVLRVAINNLFNTIIHSWFILASYRPSRCPEDWNNIYVRNFDKCLLDYMATHPEGQKLSAEIP
jgi:hypothetical protein